MKTNISLILTIGLALFTAAGCQIEPLTPEIPGKNTPEQSIAQGLSFQTFHLQTENDAEKDLLVATIDPALFTFSIYENETSENAKTIKEIHEEQQAALSFNGGFFTEEFKPTGLLISKGNKLRKTSQADLLNGILALDKSGEIRFHKNTENIQEANLQFAIQNGPVLIDEKGKIKITKETGQMASRTALGINKNGHLALIILKQSLLNSDNTISLYQFAHLLKEAPEFEAMGLHSVLNLDGGPSSGIMIGDRYYPEMEKVQNVVVVKKR